MRPRLGADVVGNGDDLGFVEHYGLGETTQSTQPSDASADPFCVDVRPDLNDATGALHSRDERSRDRALALVDVEVVDAGGLNGNLKLGRPGSGVSTSVKVTFSGPPFSLMTVAFMLSFV